MPWMTLGDALGYGLAQGVNNFVSTNNQFEQQRQQQANWQAQMDAQEAAKRQQQANWLSEQDRLKADSDWTKQRTTQLDGINLRENDLKTVLAPQVNAFMKGVQGDIERYAPTLKDGSPNPQYDPALFQAANERKKQAGKLWSNVGLGVGHGEGWEDAKGKLLSFIGGVAPSGDETAITSQDMPQMEGQPAPATVQGPDGASFTYTPEALPAAQQPAPANSPAAPPANLPKLVQDLSGADLLKTTDSDLLNAYGQSGLEWGRAKRAQYAAQVQQQQIEGAKIRAKGWETQLGELAKRTDLTGNQRLAMATITSLMAQPTLTDGQVQQLTDAFQVLTPRMYDATSWQKVLDTKDPATVLAQLPVYQQYAPELVKGFDPTPYQRVLEDDHNLTAAKVATEGSVQGKNEADANKTNVEAGRVTALLPGEVTAQNDKHDESVVGQQKTGAETLNIQADTGLKGAQAENYQAQATKTLADAAGNRQKEVTGLLASFGTFPADMTYEQIAAQAGPAIGKIKEVLGIDDAGVANLISQAQYKYGLGLRGEQLKTELAQAKVNTQTAQTNLVQTQTAATGQKIVNDTALANSTIGVNNSRATANSAAAAASIEQAKQTAALTNPKVAQVQANTNNILTRTAVTAGQGAANIALTNARTGQVQSSTVLNYAQADRVKNQISNDQQRTAAYIAGTKGKYAVDMAQVHNLNARTLLVQAQDPNSQYYNPKVAAAKGQDPLSLAKNASSLKYKQADQALQSATAIQSQISSLKKDATTDIGGFDITRLPPESQQRLKSLVAQRDKLMAQSLNAKKAGDTIIQNAMLTDAKKNPPAPVMPKVDPNAPVKTPAPASSANAPTVTVTPAASTKPAAAATADSGLGIPRPKLTGGNVKAGTVFEQKLAGALAKGDGAAIDYFGGQLVKLGYKEADIVKWIQAHPKGK